MKIRDLAVVGALVGLVAWGWGKVFAAGLSLSPGTYPSTVPAANSFAVPFEIRNSGSNPATVYANGWFTHTTTPSFNFLKTTAALTIPAGQALAQSFVFAPLDYGIGAWPVGEYRLTLELYSLPANTLAAKWQSTTTIAVS